MDEQMMNDDADIMYIQSGIEQDAYLRGCADERKLLRGKIEGLPTTLELKHPGREDQELIDRQAVLDLLNKD